MAEGTAQSKYVKLTKEQTAPVEDIQPGELNQPMQLPGRKCNECGQTLPETYQPPGEEPWTTGIFGCVEDTESCWTGLFCPCVLFGRNVENLSEDDTPWTRPCICHAIFVEGGLALAVATFLLTGVIDPGTTFLITEGLLFSWWMCGVYTGLVRTNLQKKYHLANAPCDPCMTHCCLHWCALCQEHREMKGRLAHDSAIPMTIINPPPIQEMTSTSKSHDHPTSSSNGNVTQDGNAEVQAMQA